MTPERKKALTLSSVILCAMLVCAFFSLRHGPHHAAFALAFWCLLLLNSWPTYRYAMKHRQPDPLTHLFPDHPQPKERA